MPNIIDHDMSPTPKQLHEAYSSGFAGVQADPAHYASFRRLIPRLFDRYPTAKIDGLGKGEVSMPFKAALALDSEFGSYESQTTGDCVSHATRNAGMMDYCIDAMFGGTEYIGRLATEPIYGHRGHGGQGASCSILAEYVSTDGPGGFLVRKKYEAGGNSLDLSTYDSSIGHGWGRRGTPTWINELADDNKAMEVYNLKSVDEAIAALAMGFGISMCSGYGFSDSRNEDGVAKRRGGWSHAMAWVGVDATDRAFQSYGGPLFLVQNSWGNWNSGPKKHGQPDGSFFIEPKIAESMINGGGGFVIASVRGHDTERVLDMQKKVQDGLAV
jgi:hypothetical protein